MYYWFRTLAALAITALAGCATLNPATAPRHVFVMRHLQAEAGADPSLTATGAEQARSLADWFARHDRPRAIYVSRYRRAEETAASLAAKLAIRPTVYDPADTEALVRAVKAEVGNVLIVGHSNTVPNIVERLGGARPGPIAHDQHGDIWRVTDGTGATERLTLGSP